MVNVKKVKKINKSELTRDELLNIAEKSFVKKGYNQTSINDIVKIVKVSKGGFYHHFSSKEELLSGILDRHLIGLKKSIQQIVDDKKINGAEKLKLYFYQSWDFMRPKRMLFIDLFYNTRDPFINDELCAKIKKNLVPLFIKIVEQAAKEDALDCPYPAETVELIIDARTTLVKLPHKTLHDKEVLFRYFAAFKNLVDKSLGIKKEIFGKNISEAILKQASFINKYHKDKE
ncbi:MAG: TetR/AcrR family transcriptional regulator [Patescibacteria group bacterium]|jgi:AcrR family transcriptional regulator